MIVIISLIAVVVGLGAFCALIYRLAIYALPILAAIAAGQAAYHLNAGAMPSVIVGILSGAVVLLLAPLLFSASRSVAFRGVLAVAYAAPALYAGYLLGLSLLRIGSVEGFWLQALAGAGAMVVGATAVLRLINPEFLTNRTDLA